MSASEPAAEAIIEATDPDAAPPAKASRFGKRTLIIVGVVVLLLLAAGGGAFFFLGSGKSGETAEVEAEVDSSSEEGVAYVEAPPMVVNLRGSDDTSRFLKIRFTFVPASTAAGEKITTKLPLIIDSFQPFLRELRPEDLAGSAAVFRVKEEMLVRATEAMGPGVVKDILIQDMIQQ
ncbi:flagellar basal body-associated FliL family protein [Sphingomonas sp. 37zxx]|uniref:flagellar basal body-associated FliL family protein n=1 Tax=Sphingomonas sp. 37zxx TaxID=1550073 RepID=UPI00053C037B|nr:flagellar basal body-associated FliL family protein [Sphingomonas sp. 37zxx]